MRLEFALDQLCTCDVEAADARRRVPNPDLKRMKSERAKLQRQISKAEAKYGQQHLAGKLDGKLKRTVTLADYTPAIFKRRYRNTRRRSRRCLSEWKSARPWRLSRSCTLKPNAS